jgi:glycosyltransferase involved in cell wall biosynthesis
MQIEVNYALILCTRNRPFQVYDFLQHLLAVQNVPEIVIVVDSSDGDETKEIISNFKRRNFTGLVFLKAEPGLPHQRNIGISYILNVKLTDLKCITFLDDDCRINSDYFKILRQFTSTNEFAGITGSSENQFRTPRLLARLFQIDSIKRGKVLRSGIAIPPSNKFSEKCEWMPGLCMNINPRLFTNNFFRDEWRMYYEDVEFSIRVSPSIGFVCLENLTYFHKEEQQGRLDPRLTSLYSDGARWQMSREYPGKVKKWAVIWSIIGLVLLDLARARNPDKASQSLESLIGHLIFFKRLIMQQELVQSRFK